MWFKGNDMHKIISTIVIFIAIFVVLPIGSGANVFNEGIALRGNGIDAYNALGRTLIISYSIYSIVEAIRGKINWNMATVTLNVLVFCCFEWVGMFLEFIFLPVSILVNEIIKEISSKIIKDRLKKYDTANEGENIRDKGIVNNLHINNNSKIKENKIVISGTTVIVFLVIVLIILTTAFAIKIIKDQQYSNPNAQTSIGYSKSEVIDLIESYSNKTNYSIEYEQNGTILNLKYLNRKMRLDAKDTEKVETYYIDFEENDITTLNASKKIAVIDILSYGIDNYCITEGLISVIKDSNCIVEKKEKINNRDAIVLNYNGNKRLETQFVQNENTSILNSTKFNTRIWIDEETGLLLQVVNRADNKEVKNTYTYELDSVTEEEVTTPDLSKYKVTNYKTMREQKQK